MNTIRRCSGYLVSGATHDGREHGTRSIVSGKTGLAHAGAIVNNEGCNFVIHVCKFRDHRVKSLIRHTSVSAGGKGDISQDSAPVLGA